MFAAHVFNIRLNTHPSNRRTKLFKMLYYIWYTHKHWTNTHIHNTMIEFPSAELASLSSWSSSMRTQRHSATTASSFVPFRKWQWWPHEPNTRARTSRLCLSMCECVCVCRVVASRRRFDANWRSSMWTGELALRIWPRNFFLSAHARTLQHHDTHKAHALAYA